MTALRIWVAGGRDYDDAETIYQMLIRYDTDPAPVLVHGACPTGADAVAAAIAVDLGWTPQPYPAQWRLYGDRRAGPIRNQRIADTGPDLLIAFPGGDGTANAIDNAHRVGIHIIRVTDTDVIEQSTLF